MSVQMSLRRYSHMSLQMSLRRCSHSNTGLKTRQRLSKFSQAKSHTNQEILSTQESVLASISSRSSRSTPQHSPQALYMLPRDVSFYVVANVVATLQPFKHGIENQSKAVKVQPGQVSHQSRDSLYTRIGPGFLAS